MGTNKGIENDVVKFQKQVNQLEFTQRNKVAGDVFDVQLSINISEGILFKEISIELQLLKDVFIQKLSEIKGFSCGLDVGVEATIGFLSAGIGFELNLYLKRLF